MIILDCHPEYDEIYSFYPIYPCVLVKNKWLNPTDSEFIKQIIYNNKFRGNERKNEIDEFLCDLYLYEIHGNITWFGDNIDKLEIHDFLNKLTELFNKINYDKLYYRKVLGI